MRIQAYVEGLTQSHLEKLKRHGFCELHMKWGVVTVSCDVSVIETHEEVGVLKDETEPTGTPETTFSTSEEEGTEEG